MVSLACGDGASAHANSLDGVMEDSEYLFPSVLGRLRARSVLDKPFQEVTAALGWKLHLTPRAMRRTFKNIARNRGVSKFIVKKSRATGPTKCTSTTRRRNSRKSTMRPAGLPPR